MEMPLLNELIIVFALSIGIFFVFHQLKIPAIVGFLLTGVLAGPYGLKVIKSVHEVEALAEIGVVLLLFTIGIEFSFRSLLKIKRLVLLGGSIQVLLTIIISFVIARGAGLSVNQSIFIGFLISLSSTAIVLKIIQDRAEIDCPHGRTTLGILIFQDIVAIPMMLFIPLLGGIEVNEYDNPFSLLAKGIGILALVAIGAKWIVPAILYEIGKTKNRELFLLSIIVICFTVAYMTYSIGLSLALGAFLAGLIISESEYSHEALGHITPFRDVFTSLFFISIGMLLNVSVFMGSPLLIIALTIAVILLKIFTAGVATILLGFPLRTGLLVGFKLAQIGEFSFILSKVGTDYGLLSAGTLQVFLAVSILSMVITPLLIALAPYVVDIVLKLPLPKMLKLGLYNENESKKKRKTDHIIIVGFGLNGKNLAKTSAASDIPYTVIEINPQTVKNERRKGEPIFHGDATHEAVLEFAGIKDARVLVIAISDTAATRKVIKAARKLNNEIYVIVRTRYVREVETLYKFGADEVIPEEFETSIEIFTKVLEKYLVPKVEIDNCIAQIRADGYQMFRGYSRGL